MTDASSNRVDDQHRKCQRCGLVHPCPDYAADAIPNSAHEHEWEAIGQIDRRCKRCGKVESGLEASQDWPHVGHQTRHRVAEFITYRPCGCPGAATTPHDPQVCQIQGHATRNRVPTLDQIVRALRDKDCPYLGNYKPGYDAALDDVLDEVRRAT
jgi:ribosomal protein S27AE